MERQAEVVGLEPGEAHQAAVVVLLGDGDEVAQQRLDGIGPRPLRHRQRLQVLDHQRAAEGLDILDTTRRHLAGRSGQCHRDLLGGQRLLAGCGTIAQRHLAGFVPGASPIKSIRVSAPSLERAEALAPASDGALAFRLSTTHSSPSRLQREQVGAPPSMVMSHFVLPSLQALHERLVPRQRSAATSIECMAAASSLWSLLG